jgi:predicted MFS family arabinose efflux permease
MRILQLYFKTFGGLTTPAWMLALVLLINRSGSMVIPFLSIYLKTELDFTLQQTGIILSLFGVGSLVGSMLGGWLSDRFGTFWVQFLALFLGGIGFILLEMVQSFEGLAFGFFLVTVFTDALRPANAAAVAQYAKKENITRAFSLNRMAVNLGFTIGPLAGGALATISYKWIFYADGITCIAASIVFFMYFYKRKPRNAPEETKVTTAPKVKSRSPFRDPPYLAFAALTAGFGIVFFQLFNTLPLYYRDFYQLSESTIGWLLGLNGFIVFLVEMPLVYSLGTRYSLRRLVIIGVLLTGFSYVFLNFGMGLWILVVAMILLSIAEILVMPYLTTYTTNRSDASNRGKYLGMYSMSYSVAFIVAPALGTFLLHYSDFTLLWWSMGALSVIVAVGFLYNMKDVHVAPEASKLLHQAEKELETE